MDTVSRRRRSQPAGELEAEAAARDLAYQTALSQPGITGEVPGGICAGEASPGTLESGGIVGQSGSEQLPVANPFHSERVKQEVNLIRSRPTTLDTDAARFHGEVDEAALGDSWTGGVGEPDYSAMMGQPTTEREAPRVARVEPSAAGQPASVVGNAVEGDTRLSGSKPGMMPESGMRVREERTGGETDPHLAVEEPEAGRVDDPRELIPASADRLTRVEMLLTQVLEENQVLRRQIQAESHSSYHSTRTPADLSLSPMSFGLGSRFPEGLPNIPLWCTVGRSLCASRVSGYLGKVQGFGVRAGGREYPRGAAFLCKGKASSGTFCRNGWVDSGRIGTRVEFRSSKA